MINLVSTKHTELGKLSVFLIDSEDDLSSLPTTSASTEDFEKCSMGSIASIASEGISYILNSSDEWIEQKRFVTYNLF